MKPSSAALALAVLVVAAPPSVAAADLLETNCFDAGGGFSEDVWSYCQPVAPGIFLYYTPTDDDGNALLGLRAPGHADGWSSLALAGNGGMKGASQIVVRRDGEDGEGEWVAEDRYSDDYVTPELDDSQDVQLLFATQNEGTGTSWGVAIRADSCDEEDYPIVDRSVWMHWALGPGHDFGFHGKQRGQFHANLMRPPSSSATATPIEPRSSGANDGEVIETVDIRMPNVEVVLGEGGSDPANPYICSFFDLEVLKQEHEIETGHHADQVHITGFSPIIDPESEEYVHHMILYGCDAESAAEGGYSHEKIVPECGSMPMGCQAMKWAWAVGGMDLQLPPNVGIPVGGESGSKWLVMQMHYFNPNLVEDITDSSGVQVHFTSQLREYDGGYMQLVSGVGSFQRDPMPAGQTTVAISPFVIPPACTDWDEPLNVLGVAHHEHQIGKKMTIEVNREGRNLGPMRLERRFDFNHHSSEESAIPQLLPGDEIVMSCEYDTSTRTKDVEFGEGSQDEMCYAIVFYYPRKPDKDTFIYFPLKDETKAIYETACSSPGSSDEFSEVSMCAEYYFTDIPTFLQLNIGLDFGALELCQSPLYETMLEPFFPGTCPPCHKDKTCTAEEVMAWGQNVTCPKRCAEFGGLTVWPDTSQTTSSVTHSTFCGSSMGYFEYTPIEPETCQVRGDLNVAPLEVEKPADKKGEDVAPAGSGAKIVSFGAAVVGVVAATAIAVLL